MVESLKYEKFPIQEDGCFSTVYKAKNTATSEIVALKKIKQKLSLEEAKNLREVKALEKFDHPCIIKLYEIISENKEVTLVMDYHETNLYQYYKGKKLNEDEVKVIMHKLLLALSHINAKGYFHRDLKPENVMVSRREGKGSDSNSESFYDDIVVKLVDFGLSREINSLPSFTDYVSTRWYRAPECLLAWSNYSQAIDIWALGCIAAELLLGSPLFAGLNDFDMLDKISSIFGPPENEKSMEIGNLATKKGYEFKKKEDNQKEFLNFFPQETSKEIINIIFSTLEWEPTKRPTSDLLLKNDYFNEFKLK